MHRLFLLRHANAGWAAPGMRDYDRRLTAAGMADAEALGRRMRAAGLIPEIVLCSTARRAVETFEQVASTLFCAAPRLIRAEGLYNSDATSYVEAIRQAPPGEPLLVVGHNPMMEDLTSALPAGGDPEAMRQATAGFPTCGLAVLRFEGERAALAPGTGHLQAFLKPERP